MRQPLHRLVEEAGFGLKEAAAQASIGRTSLWRWCNGLSTPTHAHAAALAVVLETTTEVVMAAARESMRLREKGREVPC